MAENTQKPQNNQDIPCQASSSSSGFDEAALQCQREAKDSIQKLRAKAAKADVPEKWNREDRVKAVEILLARLQGVCGGKGWPMPTEEEVEWANNIFAEDKRRNWPDVDT